MPRDADLKLCGCSTRRSPDGKRIIFEACVEHLDHVLFEVERERIVLAAQPRKPD
jgi:hypothetical protein